MNWCLFNLSDKATTSRARVNIRACSLEEEVKSWMPTRLLTGEGRTNGEETDKHLFGPPGY
jgi:hypothetical protein